MNATTRACAATLLFSASFALHSAPAAAHISINQVNPPEVDALGQPIKERYDDTPLKAPPCGKAGTRGTHIATFKSGSTIKLSVVEFISHPGYFRIAFDQDGEDGFKDPQTINPLLKTDDGGQVAPTRQCPINAVDKCGKGDAFNDFNNTPEVLMDGLNPHQAGAAKTWTWNVKLPDVECDNCTLQVIQVMEDDFAHGPYNPDPNAAGGGLPDNYHECVDVVLKRDMTGMTGAGGASGTAGAAGTSSGGATGTAGAPGTGNGSGGTSGTGGPGTGGAATSMGGNGSVNPPTSAAGTASVGGAGSGLGGGAATENARGNDSGDDGGCAVSPGTARRVWGGMGGAGAFGLLALGLLAARRRGNGTR